MPAFELGFKVENCILVSTEVFVTLIVMRFPAPHSKAEPDPDARAFHLAWRRRACALTAISSASPAAFSAGPAASLRATRSCRQFLTSAAAPKIHQDGVLKAY